MSNKQNKECEKCCVKCYRLDDWCRGCDKVTKQTSCEVWCRICGNLYGEKATKYIPVRLEEKKKLLK